MGFISTTEVIRRIEECTIQFVEMLSDDQEALQRPQLEGDGVDPSSGLANRNPPSPSTQPPTSSDSSYAVPLTATDSYVDELPSQDPFEGGDSGGGGGAAYGHRSSNRTGGITQHQTFPRPTTDAAKERLVLAFEVLSIIHQNLLNRTPVTQRSIYYCLAPNFFHPNRFTQPATDPRSGGQGSGGGGLQLDATSSVAPARLLTQELVNSAIRLICRTLRVSRSSLCIQASSRGLVAGCLHFLGQDLRTLSGGTGFAIPGTLPAAVSKYLCLTGKEEARFSESTENHLHLDSRHGNAIPVCSHGKKCSEVTNSAQKKRTGGRGGHNGGSRGGWEEDLNVQLLGARCVIVVEKETVFQRLVSDRLFDSFPSIIVTGRGFPDLATRAFLRFLACEYPDLPFIGFTDCNPAGVNIMLQYRSGNPKVAESLSFALGERLKWGGLHYDDIPHAPHSQRSAPHDRHHHQVPHANANSPPSLVGCTQMTKRDLSLLKGLLGPQRVSKAESDPPGSKQLPSPRRRQGQKRKRNRLDEAVAATVDEQGGAAIPASTGHSDFSVQKKSSGPRVVASRLPEEWRKCVLQMQQHQVRADLECLLLAPLPSNPSGKSAITNTSTFSQQQRNSMIHQFSRPSSSAGAPSQITEFVRRKVLHHQYL